MIEERKTFLKHETSFPLKVRNNKFNRLSSH